ncbi:hypothetical protein T440DRAFT_35571 [Plenodomus tracheiphilus IPT5]|uniref:BZIP domain-containing protein n=1 Tax=Plenodomus tracheiphilus IPT5 TaxID=1408161 RepID=A0A6A7AM25_9PLEO|nr:hypothetical protein T440DRAFT_35571 [Plenodomus tracheiphilus IPT5]
MTSTITPMQLHGGCSCYQTEMKPQVASEPSKPYGPQASRASYPHGGKSTTPAIVYLSFPMSTVPPPHNIAFQMPSMQNAPATRPGEDQPNVFSTSAVLSMYSSPSFFTASNTMATNQSEPTISPLQTRFDMAENSPNFSASFFYQDHQPRAPATQIMMPFINDSHDPPVDGLYNSPQTRYGSSSPVTAQSSGGRPRHPENAEPGSARAIYLEKNRKAANKCRSKRKMLQESLVETARDVKRKNRLLKAEVDMLKGGVQALMQIVGQHTDCADGRLGAYVQRELGRLASGTLRAPYITLTPCLEAGITSPVRQ